MSTTTNTTPAGLLLDALTAAGIRTAVDFEPSDLVMRDPECFAHLASSAAYFLSAPVSDGLEDECPDESTDAFKPLSWDCYRNDCGDYIADVDLTVGGPTIRARYESRWGLITLTASWGSDRLECTAKRCPLIDWIESVEECSHF